MWLVSVVAVYPLVIILQEWIFPQLDGMPLLVRAAVMPIVMVSVMTFVLLPLATRLLRGWLYVDGE
jgi:antibiotic biosynthesis monooxygenase (ABM) superfamily enzyme